MSENVIQLVVILFLLSMISEKVAEFLKYSLSEIKYFGIKIVGDTLTKYPNDNPEEKKRNFRILKINIVSGILIATILKADMIKIVNNPNVKNMFGWSHLHCTYKDWSDWILLPFGIILTGIFISFGSKFWHDLLDLLYQIKNTKRLLSDPKTYQVDNIKPSKSMH